MSWKRTIQIDGPQDKQVARRGVANRATEVIPMRGALRVGAGEFDTMGDDMLPRSSPAELDKEGEGDVCCDRRCRLRGVDPLGAYGAFATVVGDMQLLRRAEALEAGNALDTVTVVARVKGSQRRGRVDRRIGRFDQLDAQIRFGTQFLECLPQGEILRCGHQGLVIEVESGGKPCLP